MSIIIPQLTSANGSAYQRQVGSSIERIKYLIDNNYTNDMKQFQFMTFWIQTFSFNETPDQPDNNYDVFMTPIEHIGGTPAAGSLVINYIDKSDTGFFVSWVAPPGAGKEIIWRWKLFRWV